MGALSRLRSSAYVKTLLGVLILVVYLFPVYWMIATSLKTYGDIFAIPPQLVPLPPTITAYVQAVINDPQTYRAIINSVVISVSTLVLTLVLAAPAAYALARRRLRFTAVVVFVLLLAQMVPTIIIAGPLFIIFSQVGLDSSYLALILADTTIITLPFAIIILRPFFLSVPRDLEDAAMVDGCSRFGAFWRVVLPVVVPGLITAGAIAFLMAWGEFVFGLTLLTNEQLQPVTVALNELQGQYGTRWNNLMAVSTAIALPIVVIFVSLQRWIVSGLTAGATKE
jgi:multiple sugar transport system permease protein